MAKGKGNGAGRPSVMTKEVLAKLDELWTVGATVAEAAKYLEISEDSIYKHKRENPEYNKHIETLKGLTGLKAKINIKNGIQGGDKHDSKWYLERKDPEFKPSSKIETDVNLNAADALVLALSGGKDE